jgi:hypothetical protein
MFGERLVDQGASAPVSVLSGISLAIAGYAVPARTAQPMQKKMERIP